MELVDSAISGSPSLNGRCSLFPCVCLAVHPHRRASAGGAARPRSLQYSYRTHAWRGHTRGSAGSLQASAYARVRP